MKKAVAMVLTVVMMLAFGTTAFAAQESPTMVCGGNRIETGNLEEASETFSHRLPVKDTFEWLKPVH